MIAESFPSTLEMVQQYSSTCISESFGLNGRLLESLGTYCGVVALFCLLGHAKLLPKSPEKAMLIPRYPQW